MRCIGLICVVILSSLTQNSAKAQGPPAYTVTGRSINAISYQVGAGATKVDLNTPDHSSNGAGEAKVEAKGGTTAIDAKVVNLPKPSMFGTEFLTYVLWSVSPEGRTSNLGEIQINDSGNGELKATTQLQVFSLIVTAEPYFAVRRPSEVVILVNVIRKDTKGKIFPVSAYQLMRRAQYEKLGNPLALTLDLKHVPLEVYEARNAVDIAKSKGADRYAQDIFSKAESSLQLSENALARKANRKEIVSLARQTAQFSEDSRALAADRQEEERIAKEREAAAAQAKAEAEAKAAQEAAEAKQKADAEAAEIKRRADEDARRQAELAAAREAQLKAESEAAALRAKAEADAAAAKAKADADTAAAKAQAEADALRAREEAARLEAERTRQAAEELRAQLLEQFSRILETRDTARGLLVNMGDVLFDTGKYDLRPPTREILAKLSGIVLAHPGLSLSVEGYTDNTGSDELNQKLSEQRAGTVRSYLIGQGLPNDSITASGFGKAMPIADNDTPSGRQKNRRVEIIVSGEVIGVRVGR